MTTQSLVERAQFPTREEKPTKLSQWRKTVRSGCCFALAVSTTTPALGQYTVEEVRAPQRAVQRFENGYDYVPTILYDGKYRMWWCGSRPSFPGDHIFYAEADTLDTLHGIYNSWHKRGSSTPNTFDVVLHPTGRAGDFDSIHACDPSVIRVNGEYYMYYGGLDSAADSFTAIGVARSTDGITAVFA